MEGMRRRRKPLSCWLLRLSVFGTFGHWHRASPNRCVF
ncbi:hypothetical protein SAMN05421742_1252 [Roseospirillum parvum]|uniref:Uncharacterized protein n=1 Tax=Roseospirillum parvum TaxID=83401 RepID=A0A1G8GE13_9PROT|nr:hypothetical protein SAMN05421742_1252 [Roseospirillum parvum]